MPATSQAAVDRNEEHRQLKGQLAELREELRAARSRHREAVLEAKEHCRAERIRLQEHARALRMQTLEELRATLRVEQQAAREAHEARMVPVRELEQELHRVQATIASKRQLERELEKAERDDLKRRRNAPGMTGIGVRAETDDEVRQHLSERLLPLFERIKRDIQPTTTASRTVVFLQYAHAHPEEVLAAEAHPAHAEVKELEKYESALDKRVAAREQKKREASERAFPSAPSPPDVVLDGVRIVESDNRVKLKFDESPNDITAAMLHRAEFVWSQVSGTYQKEASADAWEGAKRIARAYGLGRAKASGSASVKASAAPSAGFKLVANPPPTARLFGLSATRPIFHTPIAKLPASSVKPVLPSLTNFALAPTKGAPPRLVSKATHIRDEVSDRMLTPQVETFVRKDLEVARAAGRLPKVTYKVSSLETSSGASIPIDVTGFARPPTQKRAEELKAKLLPFITRYEPRHYLRKLKGYVLFERREPAGQKPTPKRATVPTKRGRGGAGLRKLAKLIRRAIAAEQRAKRLPKALVAVRPTPEGGITVHVKDVAKGAGAPADVGQRFETYLSVYREAPHLARSLVVTVEGRASSDVPTNGRTTAPLVTLAEKTKSASKRGASGPTASPAAAPSEEKPKVMGRDGWRIKKDILREFQGEQAAGRLPKGQFDVEVEDGGTNQQRLRVNAYDLPFAVINPAAYMLDERHGNSMVHDEYSGQEKETPKAQALTAKIKAILARYTPDAPDHRSWVSVNVMRTRDEWREFNDRMVKEDRARRGKLSTEEQAVQDANAQLARAKKKIAHWSNKKQTKETIADEIRTKVAAEKKAGRLPKGEYQVTTDDRSTIRIEVHALPFPVMRAEAYLEIRNPEILPGVALTAEARQLRDRLTEIAFVRSDEQFDRSVRLIPAAWEIEKMDQARAAKLGRRS